MKKFFKSIITAHSGVSSKRFCGLCGFFVCLVSGIYAVIALVPVPEFMNLVLITSASLLGIDSVTGIWKKN